MISLSYVWESHLPAARDEYGELLNLRRQALQYAWISGEQGAK